MELDGNVRNALKILDARMSQYSKCELAFCIIKETNSYRVHSGVIVFLNEKEETKNPERHVYENFLLERQIKSANDGKSILMQLIDKQTLDLSELGVVNVGSGGINQPYPGKYISSHYLYGYAYSNLGWPSVRINYQIKDDQIQLPPRLASIDNPFYPRAEYGIADFMKFSNINNQPQRIIEIIIPDYRARVSRMRISEKKIKFMIETREIKENNLAAKYYMQTDSSIKLDDVQINRGTVEVNYSENFNFMTLCLFSLDDKEDIDSIDFYPYRTEQWQEIDPEAYELLIERSIQEGENYRVEFKHDIKDHEELLETVSAFSNTAGGLIILGVSDNGEIKGLLGNRDNITNIIASNCEPYPKFLIKEIKIGEVPLTIIEVEEGDNKPYSIKEKGIFVRKNATDRQISRSELDQITKKPTAGGLSWSI